MDSSEAEQETIDEARKAVERLTDSDPEAGEEMLGSEELRRQFREAKERERRQRN